MELSNQTRHSSILLEHAGRLRRWWQTAWAMHIRKAPRRLKLCESLSLGEKRVLAVVEYDKQRFLIGGGAQSVNLLARLGESPDFSELLTEWCERQR